MNVKPGPTWSTACLDWKRRIRERRSLIPFSPLFPASADQAMAIFTSLRMVDVAGQPTIGEACDEFVLDFAAAIFGAYDPETGQRLITEFLLLISKKNGKSTIAAAIMLTMLLIGWRHSAEYLILAPTIQVAGNSFGPARDMINADPELAVLLHVQTHIKTITHRGTNAKLKVVAAAADTVAGIKATGVLVDELWLFGEREDAASMLQEATGGQVSRPEGFTIYLTTQSDKPPAGVFREKLDRFRKIRDGEINDPASLGVLYEFPDEMVAAGEHLLPVNFYVTNPNLGRSVSQAWLEKKFAEAHDGDEATLQTWVAKHLNVEIGTGLRFDGWAGASHWETARADPALWDGTVDQLIEISEVIVGGVDGGGLDDLLGGSLLGRHRLSKMWLGWGYAWAQPSALALRKGNVSRMEDFARAGEMTLCDDPTQDLRELADLFERVKDAGLFPEEYAIGLDPAGVTQIIDELVGRGFNEKQLAQVPQGWRLNSAIKGAERKLVDGTFRHGGQGLLAWNVGNAKIVPVGNAVSVSKAVSGAAKIDTLVALFNAVTLMSRNPVARGNTKSFWESA